MAEAMEVIKRETVAQHAKKADRITHRHKIQSTSVVNHPGAADTGDIERFNAGVGLRVKSKTEQQAAREARLRSINDLEKPITAEMTNSVDVDPIATFSEDTQERKETIDKNCRVI